MYIYLTDITHYYVDISMLYVLYIFSLYDLLVVYSLYTIKFILLLLKININIGNFLYSIKREKNSS